MCRPQSCQPLVSVIFVMLVGMTGCSPVADVSTRGGQDSVSQGYGWWVGPGGKDTAIDIDIQGNGLQIEVIRSYLADLKIDSPVGKRWTHNYLMHIRNAPDKRIKLFGANGVTSVFTRTESGALMTQDDDTMVLKSNGDGTYSLQDGVGTVYSFNRTGRLIKIKGHQYGNTISLAYGADGYLESISDATGGIMTFIYAPDTHRLTSIRDGRGRSATYKHDDVGNLISVTNVEGITSKYSYDQRSRLVGVTFP